MVGFVLDHPGVEAGRLGRHWNAVAVHTLVAHAPGRGHRPPQARNGQAPLPAQTDILAHRLDHRIDQDPDRSRLIVGLATAPPGWYLENEQAQRHVHLRRRQADAAGILHGLDHIGDQAADLRRTRMVDRVGPPQQHRVAHAGDLEDGHDESVIETRARGLGKAFAALGPYAIAARRAARVGRGTRFAALMARPPPVRGVCSQVQVLVRDNNVDQALKALKKKMQREGIFREMKLRRHYEKPSERRAREAAEAVRRARKMERKRLEREGF